MAEVDAWYSAGLTHVWNILNNSAYVVETVVSDLFLVRISSLAREAQVYFPCADRSFPAALPLLHRLGEEFPRHRAAGARLPRRHGYDSGSGITMHQLSHVQVLELLCRSRFRISRAAIWSTHRLYRSKRTLTPRTSRALSRSMRCVPVCPESSATSNPGD